MKESEKRELEVKYMLFELIKEIGLFPFLRAVSSSVHMHEMKLKQEIKELKKSISV